MKPITFLLFLLSLCSAEKEPKHLCSRGKSVERWISNSSTLSLNQSKIDISFYDISIDINFESNTINGSVGVNGFIDNNLPEYIGIIATHPMFGPDSFISNNRLKMMMNNTRDAHDQFNFWRQFFKDQGIHVMEMSPEQHDRMAAQTQGVTHFLGRMLKEYGIRKTTIDTQGFRDLLDLVDQTCNDTWELYTDLQLYNPYTDDMIDKLKLAMASLDNRLKELQNVAD